MQLSPRALTTPNTCWVISDGAAGNERQALALAHELHVTPRIFRLKLNAPWSWLAPRLIVAGRFALSAELQAQLTPPWPDIAIGCGRQAALIIRLLKRWSDQRTFTVQILDPRIASHHFDLVIAPRHDDVRGANIIHTLGALNPIDDGWLTQARQEFFELSQLPQPRTTVLVGGTHRIQRLDKNYFVSLLHQLASGYAADGGSFLVSTSRRTPSTYVDYLRSAFAAWPGRFYSGTEDGENPYAGFLAYADRIVVTPDSVNMLSEACATGKPVATYAPQPLRGKLAIFHQLLTEAGYLGIENSAPSLTKKDCTPLRETFAVAQKILERYRLHYVSKRVSP